MKTKLTTTALLILACGMLVVAIIMVPKEGMVCNKCRSVMSATGSAECNPDRFKNFMHEGVRIDERFIERIKTANCCLYEYRCSHGHTKWFLLMNKRIR